jgi:hypothetical protein
MPDAQSHESRVAPGVDPETLSAGVTTPIAPSSAQLKRAELRRIHAGRWVAWMPDESEVAFVAGTRDEIQRLVRAARIDGLKLEAVPPASSR